MPPRKPPREVDFPTFFEGLLAVLALKGRTTFRSDPAVLDVALAHVARQMKPFLERRRTVLAFRVAATGTRSRHVAQALEAAQDGGWLRLQGPDRFEILHTKHSAFRVLGEEAMPLEVVERAAKLFLKEHEVVRVRHDLRALHGQIKERRTRPPRPSRPRVHAQGDASPPPGSRPPP